ncbi:MAG: ACP S-malonyltransferase, partial [Chloroflexota bacterium]
MKAPAFVFPGQGSQFVGMAQSLYESDPQARQVIDSADQILGYKLSDLMFNGPEEQLKDTAQAQPAILTASVAVLRVLASRTDIHPAATTGHSLGLFSALVSAGTLSFEDCLTLVQQRGRLMKETGESNPGSMAAILGLQNDDVADCCRQAQELTGMPVVAAGYNCPGQCVISGAEQAVQTAVDLASERARKATVLDVTIAAHSPLMDSMRNEFEHYVNSVSFAKPSTPLYSSTTAQPLVNDVAIRKDLIAQLSYPVRWTETVSA